jgi:hypothetical protein
VSPGATRYCFPPVLMTAYIDPPSAKANNDYTGFTPVPSTRTKRGAQLFPRFGVKLSEGTEKKEAPKPGNALILQ